MCNEIFFTGFKFNDEEAAKVNEAKKIQKWVGTWCPFNARVLRLWRHWHSKHSSAIWCLRARSKHCTPAGMGTALQFWCGNLEKRFVYITAQRESYWGKCFGTNCEHSVKRILLVFGSSYILFSY